MDSSLRIVVRLPMQELWTEDGREPKREGNIGAQALVELLRAGPVRFAVANVGCPLNWIAPSDCYRFWKTEVKGRLIEPSAERHSNDGQVRYQAVLWSVGESEPVVVVEMQH